MSFRDDGDAQRLRIDALERELDAVRTELASAIEARDRALRELEKERAGEHPTSRFRVGAPVYVEWRGQWWDATVLEVVGPSLWKVHYDGWSRSWDEVVPASRILARTTAPPGPLAHRRTNSQRATALLILAVLAVGFLYFVFRATEPTSTSVDVVPGAALAPSSRLAAGASVWAEWNGSWYPAIVRESYADGSARIHYEGYGDASDETLPRERLRAR